MYRLNNRGVALLEQFKFEDAVREFRAALAANPALALARTNLAVALFYATDYDGASRVAREAAAILPASPQPHYLLALIARADNRPADAEAALAKVLAIDSGDLGANYMMGQVRLQAGRLDEAIESFERALAAEPFNASAAYSLGQALIRAGRRDEGATWMAKFEALRQSSYHTTFGTTYLEQGRYAEALVSTGLEPDLVDPRTPDVAFTALDLSNGRARSASRAVARQGEGGPNAPDPSFNGRARSPVLSGAEGPNAPDQEPAEVTGVTLTDLDGDGGLEVVVSGKAGLSVFSHADGHLIPRALETGSAVLPAFATVAGDHDNDGRQDLLILGAENLRLLRNDGKTALTFSDVTAAAGIPSRYLARTAAFADVDHDGDLDVVAGGPASTLLLQNNGNGTFSDITARAKLDASDPVVAIVPTDADNRRDVDLLFVRPGVQPRFYRNLRDGTFGEASGEIGLPAEGRFQCVSAGDVNKDGFPDFFLGERGRPSQFTMSNGRGAYRAVRAPDVTADARTAMLFDYDLDGQLDLVADTGAGLRLLRGVGDAWVDVTERSIVSADRSLRLLPGSLGAGDLDRDGDLDLVATVDGTLRAWRNDGGNRSRSLAVRLTGRVSNQFGVGAKVEMRAGSLWSRTEVSSATPAVAPADVVFGLGGRLTADAVRILWVSGILQTELDPPAPQEGAPAVLMATELDRKPSSCPFVYAWNGERFEFVTDFLGGGETGALLAPGIRNVPDPEEYVRIPGRLLKEKDDAYELRVTNELEEVLFLDRLHLVAIAHPADVDVFPDEGLADPPKSGRLLGVRAAVPPTAAVDDRGRDMLDTVASLDRRGVDGFPLHRIRGYAADHALIVDLAGLPSENTRLLLTGWTDYSFSSDNLAAAQAGLAHVPPVAQVERADGSWVTIDERIGFPVGRPQTLIVDLQGKWLGPSRRVRIMTNMHVYWDQVLAGEPVDAEGFPAVRLDPRVADLRWRGYSAEVSPDGREPFSYDYARVSIDAPWKLFTGRFTREGDVRELLAATDDSFVVSRAGDEIALSFPSVRNGLPPGWTRTFLLHADGFSKEMDINSAGPDRVEPFPFHGMSRYPYPPGEALAQRDHQQQRADAFNTRVVAAPAPVSGVIVHPRSLIKSAR